MLHPPPFSTVRPRSDLDWTFFSIENIFIVKFYYIFQKGVVWNYLSPPWLIVVITVTDCHYRSVTTWTTMTMTTEIICFFISFITFFLLTKYSVFFLASCHYDMTMWDDNNDGKLTVCFYIYHWLLFLLTKYSVFVFSLLLPPQQHNNAGWWWPMQWYAFLYDWLFIFFTNLN